MTEVDKYISINEASKRLPGRPHISSIDRWSLIGVNGVKLETIVVERRRFVTQEAIEQFLAELNASDAERLEAEGG